MPAPSHKPVEAMKSQSSPYKTKLNRLGIAFFFDEHNIIDEYMFYLMQETMPFVSRMIFVVNGSIDKPSIARLKAMGCEVLLRPNEGFDVAAYKHGLEHVGYDKVATYDEVILFNHTFYGPIFPFSEMYQEMESRDCDFWGITSHKQMVPNPFTGEGILPRHINSHFIAVRKSMASAPAFRKYWETMPEIKTYTDSVLKHESRFTNEFIGLGYTCSIYDNDEDYGSPYPCFINVDLSIQRRCPILKRRIFFQDPIFLEQNGIDLAEALDLIREKSDYDEGLIWPNIVRTAKLRTLNTNAIRTRILGDLSQPGERKRERVKRVAVCAHIFYTEMIEELLELTNRIPMPYDFIATTDSESKVEAIKQGLEGAPNIRNVIVRVVKVNRGRDMSSLFITCRDLFLDDNYDLVCRLHTKKSPQVDQARSGLFKRHLFENLLATEGYVENVLDMFEREPWIGLAVPPVVHISYTTLGNAWFSNKPRAQEMAKALDLKVHLDDSTPVGAFGTMFWFRPKALRKLFAHPFKYEDFNAEPHHVDGGLAHVLERLIAYVAQDAGYVTEQILSQKQAGHNYAVLEFKFEKLAAHFPGTFLWQDQFLKKWAAAGWPISAPGAGTGDAPYKGAFWNERWRERDDAETEPAQDSLVSAYKAISGAWRDRYIERIAKPRRGRSVAALTPEAVAKVCKFIRRMPYYFSVWAGDDLEKAVSRYLSFGWLAGDELLCIFDPGYYLSTYPDVLEAGVHPLVHYVEHGSKELRNPHPLFNAAYCMAQLRQHSLVKSGHPLIDYLALPLPEPVQPHPLFDPSFYSAMYPEVAPAQINMFAHYLKYGAKQGRSPHALFDGGFYLETHPHLRDESINALAHYLLVGSAANHDPHPLFDVDYYRERHGALIAPGTDPLEDFVLNGQDGSRDPHPLFNAAFYCKANRARLPAGINPLAHYMTVGFKEGFKLGSIFDDVAYLNKYNELRDAGMNPLHHYVLHGSKERRIPNPLFDEGYYLGTYPEVAATGLLGIQHYLKHGAAKGYNPGPDFDTQFYLSHSPEIATLGLNPLAHYTSSGKAEGRKPKP